TSPHCASGAGRRRRHHAPASSLPGRSCFRSSVLVRRRADAVLAWYDRPMGGEATRHRVTLLAGDGIGPEVAAAARAVVDATGVAIEWVERDAGAPAIAATGDPLPPVVLESIRETGVALKGPVTTPIGTGYTSVNVRLRKAL